MFKMIPAAIVLLVGVLTTAHAQQAAQTATIWFYGQPNSGQSRTVYQIGGITDRLAVVGPNQFFGLRVTPGVHVFSYTQAPARGQSVAVPVNQGQQAYVEVRSDELVIVPQDRGIQAIQSAQPIPASGAISSTVIVPSASTPSPPVAAAPTAIPPAAQAPQAATTPSTIQSQAQVEPPSKSDANEFRRFEINWNILSYQRQGEVDLGGGTLGLTININEGFGIVADLGVHSTDISGVETTLTTYRFGPKFSHRIGGRVTFFGQFLAGGVRLRGDLSEAFGGATANLSFAGNGFSVYGGSGLDVGIRPWFAIRAIEGGYSGFYVDNLAGYELGWSNGFRVSGGIVFRFGQD